MLLKQQVECGEFYDGALRPWVHYIPVSYTFSNLTAAVQWALAHPRELRTIRRNARHYARQTLLPDRVVAYASGLLQRYVRLLRYSVRLEPDAVPIAGPRDPQLNFWAPAAYIKTKGACRRADGRYDTAKASCSRVKTFQECYARCERASTACKAFDWDGAHWGVAPSKAFQPSGRSYRCCTFRADGSQYRGDRSGRTVYCYLRPKDGG